MTALKIGDPVQLHSGGPIMTIFGFVGDNRTSELAAGLITPAGPPMSPPMMAQTQRMALRQGDAICQWFDHKDRLQTAMFRREMLKPATT